MSAISIFGMTQVETNFTKEFFIPKGTATEKYLGLVKKYYDYGGWPKFMIINYDIDFSSEEVQYQLLDWYDKIQRCYLCDQKWLKVKSMAPAYTEFNQWVRGGHCPQLEEGLSPF